MYKDSVDHRGPINNYLYAIIFLFFGRNNMIAVHSALVAIIFATGIILYKTGTLVDSRKAGCFAVFFYGIFSYSFFSYDMFAFHTEWGCCTV